MRSFKLSCILLIVICYCMMCTSFQYYLFSRFTGLCMNFTSSVVPIDSIKCYHKEKYILTNEQCSVIKNKIINLNKHWSKRNPILYTFGKSSYMFDNIEKNRVNNNRLLLNTFPELYIILLNALKDMLNTKNVYYKNDALLPGFHIFVENSFFQYPIASFHIDGQQDLNKWNKKCDLKNSISFTLSIDLPKDSPGLYLFDATKKHSRIQAIFKNRTFIPYEIGKIVLHRGNNWHIMAPSKINKNEYRMTLQGHGIKCNDSWYIYW